jgi:hypothetical protein
VPKIAENAAKMAESESAPLGAERWPKSIDESERLPRQAPIAHARLVTCGS